MSDDGIGSSPYFISEEEDLDEIEFVNIRTETEVQESSIKRNRITFLQQQVFHLQGFKSKLLDTNNILKNDNLALQIKIENLERKLFELYSTLKSIALERS